jgi:prophage regulatory protein
VQPGKPEPVARILSINAVLGMVPISRRHLYRLEAAGKFPRRIHIGDRRRGYLETDILEWQKSRKLAAEAL